MNKIIEFKVSDITDLNLKTIEYFNKSNFKQIVNAPTEKTLRFKRGSIASNMWTFNPLNWKSEIEIIIENDNVKLNLVINASGQNPTYNDEKLWNTFIDNYERFMNDSSFDFLTNNSIAQKKTKSKNLQYISWIVLGALIFGIPAGLIAYLTGITSIVYIGAVGGATALLTKKINDDKKKNSV